MPNIKKKNYLYLLFPILLLVIGFLVHFMFLWHPDQVVFDEVHYGKAVNGYLTGQYFFTGHPPLGPQLIALGAWLGGYRYAGFSFENIGQQFPNSSLVSLRIAPAIAGTLLPLVIYYLLLTLDFPMILAFAGGLLLNLDNALIVESHNALITIFVIFFGFLGLTFFIKARQRNYPWHFLLLAGIFLGLSLATEWTAAGFFIFAGVLFLYDLIRVLLLFRSKEFYKKLIRLSSIFIFAISVFLVYFAVFQIHFALLPKPGTGDVFMSQAFRQGKLNPIEKFVELNLTSYQTNLIGIKSTHPYSSKWDTWPIMKRPIFYWNGIDEKIYLLGNPVIWWGSSLAMIIFVILFFSNGWWKNSTASLLLLGYVSTYIPFIPVPRVLFLYHYFGPLIFAIMALIFLTGKMPNPFRKYVLITFIFLAAVSFLYFAPLTYGLKMSDAQYQQRVWFESWR